MVKFVTKIQVHMNHSAEVIVGAQARIYLLNSNIGDVPEDHTKIWCAMGYIINNFISHGTVLDNIDIYALTKESTEAHLLTVNIKNLWMRICCRQRQQLPMLDLCRRL